MLTDIGPIIGHACKGDKRRWHLMLEDYLSKGESRFEIPWEGWLLSARMSVNGVVHGLHNHGFIHNGKKMINPLGSPLKTFQFGSDNFYLDNLGMIYNRLLMINMV